MNTFARLGPWARGYGLWLAGGIYVAISAALLIAWPFHGFQSIETFNFFDPLVAARVLGGGSSCIYCAATQQAAATSWVHAPATSSFVDPPPVAFILQPVAGLEVHAAIITMLAVSLLCLLTAGWYLYSRLLPDDMAPSKRVILIGASFFTIASNALWAGQWAPILLLPAVGAVVCMKSGKDFSAGLLLSILLLKPNLVWLLPVVLLGSRQWRACAGMAAGGAVWAAGTVLILGFQHLSEWQTAIGSAFGAVDYSEGIPGVVASLTSTTAASWSVVLLGLLAIGAAVRWGPILRDRADLVVGIGITVSLLSTPHVYDYDLILLALPLCLWAITNTFGALTTAIALRLVFATSYALGALSPTYLTWMVLVVILIGLIRAATRPQVATGLHSHHNSAPVAGAQPS